MQNGSGTQKVRVLVFLTHISWEDGESESWLFVDASNLTRGSLKLDSNTLNSVTIHHLQAWYMYKHDTEYITHEC